MQIIRKVTVCLSCATSLKSAFSKPGFLATTEHSAHVWGKRREAESGKSGNSGTKEQRTVIHKEVGEPGLVPPLLPQCTLHAWHSLGRWTTRALTGSFIKVTFMWRGTVLRQCLQFACHKKFFSRRKRGKFMKKHISFFYPHLPLAAEATFRVHCEKFPLCLVCSSLSWRMFKRQLIREHNNNGFH